MLIVKDIYYRPYYFLTKIYAVGNGERGII